MAYIYPCHRGLAYGDGHLQGEGKTGQIVRLVGDELFAVNTNSAKRSFGILVQDYPAGEMPGIYCDGGVYETDVFEGTLVAGEDLKASATGRLTNGVTPADQVVAQAISVNSGVLKFRLLI